MGTVQTRVQCRDGRSAETKNDTFAEGSGHVNERRK